MNELLWKDYRVNRMVLIVGIVLLFGPLFAVGVVNLYAQVRYADQIYWFDKIVSTGLATLAFAFVTLAMLGGNAFAGERADRSAEFMAYLPPTRRQKLLSKSILALVSVAVVLGVILLICYGLASIVGAPSTHSERLRGEVVYAMIPAVLLTFGAAWCGSSVLSSATFAVGIGFAAPWLLYAILATLKYGVQIPNFGVAFWFALTASVLAVMAFVTGCILYLRRVEP